MQLEVCVTHQSLGSRSKWSVCMSGNHLSALAFVPHSPVVTLYQQPD